MNSLIVSNSTARSETAINEIRLDFTQAPLELKNTEVALGYLGLYYSWRNITTSFGNNGFSYVYNGTTFPVALPDGYYSIKDLNNFLELTMRLNNHYVLDADGEPIFFISFRVNETFYTVTFDLDVIEVPLGGSNPHLLVTGNTMQIVIPNTPFAEILGANPGTYPAAPATSKFSFDSQKIPNISPITSVIVSSNISSNQYNQFRDSIFTFAPTSQYASFLTFNPAYPVWGKVIDGTYDNISIRFYDQNYRPLALVDKFNITATLLFRKI